MLTRFFTILFVFLTLQATAASYPVDIVKGFIITQAVINDQTVNVILDTGAPGFVLNEKYYDKEEGQGLPCEGINGRFSCGTHMIQSWSWLGAANKKTKALVSDLSFLENSTQQPIYAIIGLSVLDNYYVSIDIDNQEILVHSKAPDIEDASFSRFYYVDHLPVITCKVNGQKKILGLDTGSGSNYLFNFDPDKASLTEMKTTPVIVTGTGNLSVLKHRITLDLEVPKEDVTTVSSFIVDDKKTSQFDPYGFDGILGQDFLSQYNLVIHPGKQKLALIPRLGKDLAME